MAQKPAAQTAPQTTRGTVDALPCPWCHQPNDLREEMQQGWSGGMQADMLQQGNVYQCDHCKRRFEIQNVKPVTLVWAKPVR